MRNNIKEALLSMLANTDHTIIKAAATCVAAIAVIELPLGLWTNVIELLSTNANSNDINVRLASLQTLGFICEDINPDCLPQETMNLILSALMNNVLPDQVMLTNIAVKAFARAAPITDKNFCVPEQKQFIMAKLFEASQIKNEDILTSTMEAFIDIARVNYDYMPEYIQQIAELTLMMINQQEFDQPAKLAIEIWTTISEVELARRAQNKEHRNILVSCTDVVMQIITTALNKFDQNTQDQNLDDMPENNISISAGYTLESVARTIGNGVLQPIFNFIQDKLGSQNWGDRYIGMIAFGSIIDGPNPQEIINSIHESYLSFLAMLDDQVPKVRQTAAFVYYKISEFVPQLVFSS